MPNYNPQQWELYNVLDKRSVVYKRMYVKNRAEIKRLFILKHSISLAIKPLNFRSKVLIKEFLTTNCKLRLGQSAVLISFNFTLHDPRKYVFVRNLWGISEDLACVGALQVLTASNYYSISRLLETFSLLQFFNCLNAPQKYFQRSFSDVMSQNCFFVNLL